MFGVRHREDFRIVCNLLIEKEFLYRNDLNKILLSLNFAIYLESVVWLFGISYISLIDKALLTH